MIKCYGWETYVWTDLIYLTKPFNIKLSCKSVKNVSASYLANRITAQVHDLNAGSNCIPGQVSHM